jgi:3-hydroxyisobutyrate dehydrogenase-like beta-hydroxyacid dehydrogenase
MSQSQQVAVVGLGSMGYGIGQSLIRAGHQVSGFDVSTDAQDRLKAEGGQNHSVSDIAGSIDALVVVVLNAAQLQAVLFDDPGWANKMKPGSVVIACPTIPPATARALSEQCESKGLHYLDAPISGGAVKSAAGQLSVMASGSDAAFSAARPVLDATAETVFELGESAGAGSAMKAVNQLLAGVHIATMAEAMTFGVTQGIEPAQLVKVISQCAGTSWMFENRAPHIVDGDYTPHSSVNIWPKDLGIVLDIAAQANYSAPITKTALEQFTAAAEKGLGHEDDAAVAKIYAAQAKVKLPGQ